MMEATYLDHALTAFLNARDEAEGRIPKEYKISPFIENDIILGNPDKCLFIIKDMVANFGK